MRHRLLILATLCAAVSGCEYPRQTPGILVVTTPPGASCLLTRFGQPLATVAATPAIALVDPAAGDITIDCTRQGFAEAAITVPARETGSSPSLFDSRPPYAYPPQVDIVLQPRRLGLAPR
jgi:hypothetical protein